MRTQTLRNYCLHWTQNSTAINWVQLKVQAKNFFDRAELAKMTGVREWERMGEKVFSYIYSQATNYFESMANQLNSLSIEANFIKDRKIRYYKIKWNKTNWQKAHASTFVCVLRTFFITFSLSSFVLLIIIIIIRFLRLSPHEQKIWASNVNEHPHFYCTIRWQLFHTMFHLHSSSIILDGLLFIKHRVIGWIHYTQIEIFCTQSEQQ